MFISTCLFLFNKIVFNKKKITFENNYELDTLINSYLIEINNKKYYLIFLGNSKIAETKLGPIEYKMIGDKGPILMSIHGSPGGYDQNIISSDAFRILILSRPGYLRTPLGVGQTPAEQATAYSELLDVLGIQKVVVMGISGGGPSSMEFAAKFPEKTLGLIAFEAVSYSEDYANKFTEMQPEYNSTNFLRHLAN